MTPEEWATWKSSPATVKFFKYLSDFREEIARSIARFVADGVQINPQRISDDAFRCEALVAVEETQLEDINLFYGVEDDETSEQ